MVMESVFPTYLQEHMNSFGHTSELGVELAVSYSAWEKDSNQTHEQ